MPGRPPRLLAGAAAALALVVCCQLPAGAAPPSGGQGWGGPPIDPGQHGDQMLILRISVAMSRAGLMRQARPGTAAELRQVERRLAAAPDESLERRRRGLWASLRTGFEDERVALEELAANRPVLSELIRRRAAELDQLRVRARTEPVPDAKLARAEQHLENLTGLAEQLEELVPNGLVEDPEAIFQREWDAGRAGILDAGLGAGDTGDLLDGGGVAEAEPAGFFQQEPAGDPAAPRRRDRDDNALTQDIEMALARIGLIRGARESNLAALRLLDDDLSPITDELRDGRRDELWTAIWASFEPERRMLETLALDLPILAERERLRWAEYDELSARAETDPALMPEVRQARTRASVLGTLLREVQRLLPGGVVEDPERAFEREWGAGPGETLAAGGALSSSRVDAAKAALAALESAANDFRDALSGSPAAWTDVTTAKQALDRAKAALAGQRTRVPADSVDLVHTVDELLLTISDAAERQRDPAAVRAASTASMRLPRALQSAVDATEAAALVTGSRFLHNQARMLKELAARQGIPSAPGGQPPPPAEPPAAPEPPADPTPPAAPAPPEPPLLLLPPGRGPANRVEVPGATGSLPLPSAVPVVPPPPPPAGNQSGREPGPPPPGGTAPGDTPPGGTAPAALLDTAIAPLGGGASAIRPADRSGQPASPITPLWGPVQPGPIPGLGVTTAW